jgi:hypothetical protein
MGLLLHLTPFGNEGEAAPAAENTPFLLIHDTALFQPASGERLRIDPSRWVQGACTRSVREFATVNVTADPVIIYKGSAVDLEVQDTFDRANICDGQDQPERPAYISWNYSQELTISQGMHLSTQPFILRKYAQHVAQLWEQEYHRRPAVHAVTGVSLNGRPAQPLVDPTVDLASVPAAWLRHNTWILNLQTRRIPQGVIPMTR